METIYCNPTPEILLIGEKVFGYKGRKYKVQLVESTTIYSYWDGGSKDYYALLRREGMAVSHLTKEYGNPFVSGAVEFTIPPGHILVKHNFFCGKDMGITLMVRPDEMDTLMLPAKEELSRFEKIVLVATAHLKSSYGGVKDLRFHQAHRETGISREDWEETIEVLIKKGLLLKNKAITPDGRNAIGDLKLYDLEDKNA